MANIMYQLEWALRYLDISSNIILDLYLLVFWVRLTFGLVDCQRGLFFPIVV